jgi:uncharacterized protein (UPF0332 family)
VSLPQPEHFFAQAEALAGGPTATQVDLRRAISAAYYGLFHFTLQVAANLFVGADKQSTAGYALVYRSVDHGRFRTLGAQLGGTKSQSVPLMLNGGFGKVADFARIAANLYELRNLADYDPLREFTTDEAKTAVSNAREAVKLFQQGTVDQQEAFLTLLLFKPRKEFQRD